MVWFASNDIHVVPYDEGERRFKLFELDNHYAGVTTPETKAYFDPLWKLPHEVYAMFLYHYDISEWDPRSFRIGVAEQAQMAASLGSVQLWWKHCLDREFVALEEQRRPDTSQEFQRETMHQRTWVFGGLAVPKSVVYDDYKRYCQNNRTVGFTVIDSTWSKELGMLTELTHYRAPRDSYYGDLGTKQPHCYRFHTLRQCREKWTSHYGEQDTEGWGEDTTGVTHLRDCPEWVPKP